jgi:hypothetical protein
MAEEKQNPTDSLPAASFSTLVLSLAMSALQQMAEPEEPDQAPRDYRLAKPMIDSLEVLKEKTRGNLTPDESALLDSLLFDLRLRFLKASSRPRAPSAQPDPAAAKPPEKKFGEPG